MSTTPTPPPTAPTPPPTPPPPGLSTGQQIEYKAFARSFTKDKKMAVLCLATCSYLSSGFTIFFEEDSGKFKLMEQPPTGVFRNMVTYYSASWPTANTSALTELPKHVTITDAHGDHKVQVKAWE